MKQGENHRLLIKTDDEKAFCFDIKGKRKLKITEDMRIKIGQWIETHEHVIQSPCMNDILKINGQNVAKQIREISVTDLHRDLSRRGMEGILGQNNNIIIGETSLCSLLKLDLPHLKRATTKHMVMCGCVTCIVMNNIQRALNSFRKRKVGQLHQKFKHEEKRLHDMADQNSLQYCFAKELQTKLVEAAKTIMRYTRNLLVQTALTDTPNHQMH
jgi:hypothetical protein